MFGKCLSCQSSASDKDLAKGYHRKCSKQLFGTAQPPDVPFKSTDVTTEAQKMVGRMSISGVQPKLSVIHDRKRHELTVVDRGGRFILKPPTDRFESLPENENLCMNIALTFGIEVPPHGLLPLIDGKLAYVVIRFDRLDDGSKLQQEDFQQLLDTHDKYDGSYERIAKFIKKHSGDPDTDLMKLYERAILFFVIGNGDAHLKNFSLIRNPETGYYRTVRITSNHVTFYDLFSSNYNFFTGIDTFKINSQAAPLLSIAIGITSLHMQYSNIGYHSLY